MPELSIEETIRRLTPPQHNQSHAYKMGRDCALHGANETNCHFSIFSSKENTKEWERGKREAASPPTGKAREEEG